jgi:uncharacterized 2Fe-2S/4Fe-4S cluster protein (DUF4445 family)
MTPAPGFGLAVDIGTTTVVMLLVDRATGAIVASDSFLNPQRLYGADVISRIRVASRGNGEKLRAAIRGGLRDGLTRLISAAGIGAESITSAALAANTTMMHLLLGLPCEGLGVAPFTPAATVFPDMPFDELFGDCGPIRGASVSPCAVRFAPAVSSFIGGDVVAGLAALGLGLTPGERGDRDDRGAAAPAPELFIDFGTNAEMALSSDGAFHCASAAAGPAFEGQSISCGAACVPGAISSVYLDGSRFGYAIIGDAKPVGLCGSAIVDLVSLGLELGLIRKDGSLSPVCESSGIVLDPGADLRLLGKDVREIQVARAAIRAGISVLLESAGVRERDVSRVHLAGGFGYYLSERSALGSGLLPRAFAGKISGAGNTSLAGAVRMILDPGFAAVVDAVVSRSRVVQLADHPSFNDAFIGFMEFD